MILKIERYNNQYQWWMYDNIRKISISNPFPKAGISDKDYDVVLFDVNTDCTCSGPGDKCNECRDYLVAICKMTDDSEMSIAFDTIAYLLNDSGKTIEKIVSNYRIK
jgi:hypothetical protein